MTLIATKKGNRLLPDLYEEFLNDRFFDNLPQFPLSATSLPVIPNANVVENPEDFQIDIAAPGLEKDDFKVEIQNGMLRVSAEKEEKKKENGKNFRRKEFSFSSFSRSFALPDNLVSDKIAAKYENGVLKVTLPKKEVTPAEPSKQIEVK